MVSVRSNLALCSEVIDLKSVVEAVRAAERCFPVTQLVAKAPQTRLFGALGGEGGVAQDQVPTSPWGWASLIGPDL